MRGLEFFSTNWATTPLSMKKSKTAPIVEPIKPQKKAPTYDDIISDLIGDISIKVLPDTQNFVILPELTKLVQEIESLKTCTILTAYLKHLCVVVSKNEQELKKMHWEKALFKVLENFMDKQLIGMKELTLSHWFQCMRCAMSDEDTSRQMLEKHNLMELLLKALSLAKSPLQYETIFGQYYGGGQVDFLKELLKLIHFACLMDKDERVTNCLEALESLSKIDWKLFAECHGKTNYGNEIGVYALRIQKDLKSKTSKDHKTIFDHIFPTHHQLICCASPACTKMDVKEKMGFCKNCKMPYCSKECQVFHWKNGHKHFCQQQK